MKKGGNNALWCEKKLLQHTTFFILSRASWAAVYSGPGERSVVTLDSLHHSIICWLTMASRARSRGVGGCHYMGYCTQLACVDSSRELDDDATNWIGNGIEFNDGQQCLMNSWLNYFQNSLLSFHGNKHSTVMHALLRHSSAFLLALLFYIVTHTRGSFSLDRITAKEEEFN